MMLMYVILCLIKTHINFLQYIYMMEADTTSDTNITKSKFTLVQDDAKVKYAKYDTCDKHYGY
jgi:hypothetical protein